MTKPTRAHGRGRCAPLDALSAVVTFAIRRAVRATRLGMTPEAVRAARANAEAAGAAAGIPLGRLFSVVEPSAAIYGYDPALGNFGPGQFCGMVRLEVTYLGG